MIRLQYFTEKNSYQKNSAQTFRRRAHKPLAHKPCAQTLRTNSAHTLRTNPAHKLRTHLAHKLQAQRAGWPKLSTHDAAWGDHDDDDFMMQRLWQGGVCTRRTHKHPAHKVHAQAPRTKRTSPHKPHKLRTNPHKPHKPCAQKEFFSIKHCSRRGRGGKPTGGKIG